jgi:hypothetical protein
MLVGLLRLGACGNALMAHKRTKEGNAMFRRPKSSTYQRALSFKWLVGVIFILAAFYAYLVNHDRLLDAAILFGIGVILA